MFDRQVLLDPFEKRLDRPAVAVDLCNGQCGQIESIGQEHKELVCFGIAIGNPTQAIWVGEPRFWRRQQDALVAAQPCRFVDFAPGDSGVAHIVLGPDDEGDLPLMHRLKSGEVEIATVDDDNGAGRPMNHVENVDVVNFARSDMDKHGYRSTQIDDGVRLDGGLGRAEICPREQTQTQVDGGGVHRIKRFLDSQADVFALIQFDGRRNQSVTECFEQAPVAPFVGVGQRRTGYFAANPDVVKLGALRVETRDQISQSFPSSQLGIRDAEKMIPGREVLNAMVPRRIDRQGVRSD